MVACSHNIDISDRRQHSSASQIATQQQAPRMAICSVYESDTMHMCTSCRCLSNNIFFQQQRQQDCLSMVADIQLTCTYQPGRDCRLINQPLPAGHLMRYLQKPQILWIHQSWWLACENPPLGKLSCASLSCSAFARLESVLTSITGCSW